MAAGGDTAGAGDAESGATPSDNSSEPATWADGYDDARAEHSGRCFYAEWFKQQDWWVDWVRALPLDDDGELDEDATPTKQPIAPYDNGDGRPVQWHAGLDDDEHPATDHETVQRWEGLRLGLDLSAPERVVSDTVGTGIIIPVDQDADDGRTVTLIDWDDVRDPETEAIHPVAAWALDVLDCYAEISQSGKGIHQFVFGEIPGALKKFIRHIDDEPFVGDDLPQVEMYQSGRLCAMTGKHVAGSGEDVTDGQDVIDRLCWEFGMGGNAGPGTPTDPFGRERKRADAEDGSNQATTSTPDHATVADAMREAVEYDGVDPAKWDIPDEHSLEYAAVLRARERSDELPSVANWELLGYAAALGHRDGLDQETVLADLEAHPTPQYGYDHSRARKEVRAVYRKAESGNYHPPSRTRLGERGILPPSVLDDLDGGQYEVKECEPPEREEKTINIETRRAELRGERFDDVLADDHLALWGDEAGVGKTTNAGLAALERDVDHAILLDKHRKAREYLTDEPILDAGGHQYHHQKGAEQKRESWCMDADHAGTDEDCPEHGHSATCPSMCPVYDMDAEHPTRQAFEALVSEVGVEPAHRILGLGDDDAHDWHPETCAWLAQFDDADAADAVAGVHPYLTQTTVTGDELTIIDETPALGARDRELDQTALLRMAETLDRLADVHPPDEAVTHTAREFAEFVRAVVDLTIDRDVERDLGTLSPPTITWSAYETYNDVAGNHLAREQPAEDWQLAEALAEVKLAYGETVHNRMQRDEWEGTPLSLDPLLGAAVAAGLDIDPVRRALAAPAILDRCPRCHSTLTASVAGTAAVAGTSATGR
jgi:hypothetical protein